MNLKLTGMSDGQLRSWPIDRPVLTVGRSSRCDVQLVDATVSKSHAEIVQEGGDRLQLRDLGSRNGTRLNGNPVTGPVPLKAGDRVEFGSVSLEVAGADVATMMVDPTSVNSSLQIPALEILRRSTTTPKASPQLFSHLARLGQLLILPRPVRETCEQILDAIEPMFSWNRLMILLRPAPDKEPQPMGVRLRAGAPVKPMALSQTILDMVLNQNTSVVTSDAASDPRFQAQASIIAQMIHSAMAVPLFDNEQVLGLMYADSTDPRVIYGQEQLELFTLVANMAAVKITNAHLLEMEQARARMAQELATAARIQRGLLPSEPPKLPGCAFHARLESCYEVGGDLYDFANHDDGSVSVLVGDVSGKGMGAALLMSSFLSSWRVLADAIDDPALLIRKLNELMVRTAEPGNFITAFVGRVDPAKGTIRYVNAGHPPPIVIENGQVSLLDTTGIPVGMIPGMSWECHEKSCTPGALLAIFTDGIPEAKRGEEYFEDDRLVESLVQLSGRELPEIADEIMNQVDAFLDGTPRSDDITLVLFRNR